MSKYRSVKTMAVDGTLCDSKKEALRLNHLLLMERAGVIKDLQKQVKFVLIPKQVRGGKVVERECSYIADFVYWENRKDDLWVKVVEDVKSSATRKKESYIIKRKLMLWVNGIAIKDT